MKKKPAKYDVLSLVTYSKAQAVLQAVWLEPFATAAFRQRLTTGLLARYVKVNDSVADPGLGGGGGGRWLAYRTKTGG